MCLTPPGPGATHARSSRVPAAREFVRSGGETGGVPFRQFCSGERRCEVRLKGPVTRAPRQTPEARSRRLAVHRARGGSRFDPAGVAQPVEHLFCKQAVRGSSPLASSSWSGRLHPRFGPHFANRKQKEGIRLKFGGLPEWPKGAGCKPAGASLRWFESITLHPETGWPEVRVERETGPGAGQTTAQIQAGVAQLVERQPSKLNVAGSNPVSRSDRVPT